MNSAEFKTLREAIGLSVSDVAKMASVKSRSVQYWESARSQPPDDVCDRLLEIDTQIDAGVRDALAAIEGLLNESGGADEITLMRYLDADDLWGAHPEFDGLPVTCHAAYLARVKRALETKGEVVRIVYSE